MKSYKVFRKVGRSEQHMMVYDHLTDFDKAKEMSDALQKKTGDTCYVVEYATSRHHPHRNRRNSLV